jgi:hypothetical protein
MVSEYASVNSVGHSKDYRAMSLGKQIVSKQE